PPSFFRLLIRVICGSFFRSELLTRNLRTVPRRGDPMRRAFIALTLALLAVPLRADPPSVTVITKDARHTGSLSINVVELQTGKRTQSLPLADIASIQFG